MPRTHFHPTPRHRALPVAALTLAACACALLTGCRSATLTDSPERLPYALTPTTPMSVYSGSFEAVDLDGDGVDEEIKYDEGIGGAAFLSVARLKGNQFYNLHTRHLMSAGGVCGVADITGDGTPELIWWWHESRERVRVIATEVLAEETRATLRELHSVEFDTEGALLPDRRWGATVAMNGEYSFDGDGVTDALSLVANAGITLRPREILLWDFNRGIAWRLPTGATPTGGKAVVDITGDGRQELVIGLESPGNGASEGIWNDGHAYLIAVDTDGGLLWSHELAGYSSNIELATADLDGNGTVEIVTALNYHSEADHVSPELAVWGGSDGALLDTLRTGCPVNAVLVERCAEGNRIFAGSADGALRRIKWEPGALTIENELDCGDAVEDIAAVSFDPALAGWSLVAGTGRGKVAVLDEKLTPLALTQVDEIIDGSNLLRPTAAWTSAGPVKGLIVRTRNKTHRYALVRRPLQTWIRLLAAAIATVAAVAAVPASRRATLAVLRRWLLPKNTRDESIEALLAALATAGHGKLAATSTPRRLRRQFEMICAQDGDVPEAFEARFMDAVANARDVGVPGLETIARLSERVGTAPAHTGRLSSALRTLNRLLCDLPARLPDESGALSLGSALDRILPTIDGALLGIKSAVESERSSSLGVELGRVLDSRRDELEQLNVELEAPNPRALRSARVLGTPGEMTFVLDNLLGNATSAMADAPLRRLRISVEVGQERVTLGIEDTGKGIPESMHEQVFARGVSGRAGGGHGLWASREILGRRGGKIELVRSVPGEGTVFEVELRLCQGE